MKIDWSSISPDLFEQMVGLLLRAMGYENVTVRTGGSDAGWDLDAVLCRTLPDGTLDQELWRVECKRRSYKPASDEILNHYQAMSRQEDPGVGPADHLLFVTCASFANITKKKIEGYAKKDGLRVHFWEQRKLEELVSQHSRNSGLAQILAPFVEIDLSFDLLRKACRRQVETEIQYRVGRKYIPELFQAPPIAADLQAFIAEDLERQQLEELRSFLEELAAELSLPEAEREEWSHTLQLLEATPDRNAAQPLVDPLVEQIGERSGTPRETLRRVGLFRRSCFLIKERAGSGKTNLLCRLASEPETPATVHLFLSCKFDLPESRSLLEVIGRSLRAALMAESDPGEGPELPQHSIELMEMVAWRLRQEKAQMVVFLDGINENRDLGALDRAILELFAGWSAQPIKWIVTCRDIFWTFFSESGWSSFLYGGQAHELPPFTVEQIEGILEAYFEAFEIRGRLVDAARERCRHPLILRFFCEAFQGKDIREYGDLRLSDLFEVYWSRKTQEIAEAMGWGSDGGHRVERFLFRLVDAMVERFATQIPLGEVEEITGEEDFETETSLYKRLRDQDIILEELPPPDAFDQSFQARRISFVYDEFYDYMMALSFLRKNRWDEKESKELALDLVRVIRSSQAFEQLRGVAEYLVLLVERKQMHRVLCATLARLGSYEVLFNVLPKLRDGTDWMPDLLKLCLLSHSEEIERVTARSSSGWRSTRDQVESLIRESPSSELYERLVQP